MAERVFSYRFEGKFDNLRSGLAAGSKSVDDFGKKLTAVDRQGAQMRASLTAVGASAGRVGLVAAAGLGAIVIASANFDAAMSKVAATGDDARQSLDSLREAAIKAGASTSFSASEAAAGIEELAKAGVSAQDILAGGLAGALDLAAAGGLQVGEAAEIAATALTQFKLSGEDVPHVADLLAAGAGKAQGSVDDLGMALKQSGLVAAQTGLSIEETTGALSAFASAGLLGSDAGTSFKTLLQSLTPSSKEAADTMAELGISAYDAQGNFIGLTEFADNLRNGLSGLSTEQQNAALKTIFGADAVRAAAVIYDQGATGVQSWIDKTNDAGYAAETAATRLDNLRGDVEGFTGALETALIGSGDGSTGMLRELVQGATAAVNAFNAMPGPIKGATTGLLAVTAVTGGALWFGSKVVGGIAATNAALTTLGITANVTAGSLARVGGAAALISVAGFDALGRTQDWQAGREAADATADSFEKLTAVLQSSNLGRHASDLGVDVQMLAKDLIENGESGEYVTQVMNDLNDASSGVGAMFKEQASIILPGWTASSVHAYDAHEDLGNIISNNTDLLGSQQAALTSTAGATDTLAAATGVGSAAAEEAAAAQKAQAEALSESRKAARATADQFFNLGESLNDSKTSLREWIHDMQQSADDLRNFRVNAEKAADNGLRKGLIAALQEAGPEGARRMRQLAEATDSEIAKANRAWSRGQAEVKKYTSTVGGVPQKAGTVFSTVGIPKSLKEILSVKNYLDLLPTERTIYITTRHRVVGSVADALPDRTQRKAAGGPIVGPGGPTSDSVPVMASAGEFMMSARAVQHYGLDTMFAMNARHLASGGSVDGTKDSGGGRVGLSIDVGQLRRDLKSWSRELGQSEKALSAETKQRDSLIQQSESVRSSVAGGLRQDLWANENPWSANGMGPTGRANAVAATASEFTKLVTALRGKGLDGAALAEAAASGDISRLRFLNSLPAASLNAFEAAINAQESALRAAGVATSGALGLNDQAAAAAEQVRALEAMNKAQERSIKRLEKTIERASDSNANKVVRGVNGAGSRGDRNKRRDRSTQ